MTDKNIYAALAKAQTQMGKALKDSNNPHFNRKYADLSSVMDACLPALNSNGFAVIQPTIDDETGRYVETVLLHEGGGDLRCRVPLIIQKNDMQGYGSAVTYARRYGLMCMAGIAPEDDDGNAAVKAAPEPEPKFNAVACRDRLLASLAKRKTKQDIADWWKSESEALGDLKDADAPKFAEVRAAVKAAGEKAEPAKNDDLKDDIIPY